MRVLLTLRSLDRLGGVQTYTRSLIQQLTEEHQVGLLSMTLGNPALTVRKMGATLVRSVADLEAFEPDLVHAQHRQLALLARSAVARVPMVFHAHGVVPSDEQPPSVDLGISQWIAVSEEVEANLRKKGATGNFHVLRNPVDTAQFRPVSGLPARPRRAVILGRDLRPQDLATVEEACAKLGIALTAVGTSSSRWRSNMPKVFNGADIVFALGRGAIESMSCGRATYVYGQFGSDGWVSEESVIELAKHNFSGRRYRRSLTPSELAVEISQGYGAHLGEFGRVEAEAKFALADHLPALLGIYEAARPSTATQRPESPELKLILDQALAGPSRGEVVRRVREAVLGYLKVPRFVRALEVTAYSILGTLFKTVAARDRRT